MNWYKLSQKVSILSHDSEGYITVLIDGKRYLYHGMNPFLLKKLEAAIKYNNRGSIFGILRSLRQLEPEPKKIKPSLFQQ